MLQRAFEQGCSNACARFGVKIAAVPLARPIPRMTTPHVPKPGFKLTPQEEAQALRMKSQSPAQRQQELGLDRDTQNTQFAQRHDLPSASPVAAAGRGARGAGGFMRPIKRGLGLAALGAAGTAAYGLHKQHHIDEEKIPLVYAPLQGGF